MVDTEPILFEILDTCPKKVIAYGSQYDEIFYENIHKLFNLQVDDDSACGSIALSETTQWADGLLLVYSITDRDSFNFVKRVKAELQTDTPVLLVANKADMVHLRQVSYDEGEILAKDYECKFSEVSAAEHVAQVTDTFQDLCREVLTVRRKSKQSLLDRVLGNRTYYSRGKSDSALPKD